MRESRGGERAGGMEEREARENGDESRVFFCFFRSRLKLNVQKRRCFGV